MSNTLNEIFAVATNQELSETGGGHGQKGVEFQRNWALIRMFELERAGAEDYLFLFEAIQDVSELDSCDSPKSIRIYQVKKKDRREWTWTELTGLASPKTTGKKQKSTSIPSFERVKVSPLGKLYANVIAFNGVVSEGIFVSNSGCDLPMAPTGNYATSLPCNLTYLPESHRELLAKGLMTLNQSGMPIPDLSRIHIMKVALPPDDPNTQLIGVAAKFLESRSKKHAGQARSLVEALMAKISPLGAKTDSCKNFEEMCQQHGFSKEHFTEAISVLETIPDYSELLNDWFVQLGQEGMTFMDLSPMRAAVAGIYRKQLLGKFTIEEQALMNDCATLLNNMSISQQLKPLFENLYGELKVKYSSFKRSEILAHVALQAIKKCMDQI